MFPPESVALNVGTTPTTGLLFLFLRVTVTGAEAAPSATTGPEAVIDEFVATDSLSTKVTVPVIVDRPAGELNPRVFTSSNVDLR